MVKEKGSEDTAEETLSHEDMQAVKRAWEWYEMWYELDERQKRFAHLPSIYNAVLNNRSGNKERISRIYQMHSNKQNSIDFIEAGDIGAAVGFKDIKTGDTLSSEKAPIILESMVFPDPVIGVAVEPKTKADVDKLGMALGKLAEEDPTFQVKTDEASGQTVISGMGELHLDIIVDRLRREFKVEVNQGKPQVEYKEAITASAQHREVYKKQTGGRGKFADIVFTMEPGEEEKEGLEFINKIKGGNIPKEYLSLIHISEPTRPY